MKKKPLTLFTSHVAAHLSFCLLFSAMMAWFVEPVSAQEREPGPSLGVKSNLLYWATTSPNFGVEFRVAPRWTLEGTVGWNPWAFSGQRTLEHWLVKPEARYWFCRAFEGGFLGMHLLYGQFDAGNLPMFNRQAIYDHTYDGRGAGAGLTGGYHFPLGRRWGLELSAGAGYLYLDYDKYRCEACRDYVGHYRRNWFGPTKAALNFIYLIH